MRELKGIKKENTHEDKRLRIEKYFAENPTASNVQASKELGISRPTIVKYRPEI
jgi:ACT domain-containing protein